MSLPFQLPNDRPLTYGEQMALWRDTAPESIRKGWPDDKDEEGWAAVRMEERAYRDRHGWLLNRLDWDREWVGPTDTYYVPEFCQPGAKRERRAWIASVRRDAQNLPNFKGALGWEKIADDIGGLDR